MEDKMSSFLPFHFSAILLPCAVVLYSQSKLNQGDLQLMPRVTTWNRGYTGLKE